MNKPVKPAEASASASLFPIDTPLPRVVGTIVDNGHEQIVVPEAELKQIDAYAAEMKAEDRDRALLDSLPPEKRKIVQNAVDQCTGAISRIQAERKAKEQKEFSWSSDRECVVLNEQPATAIYWNENGDFVIRQHEWPDDDTIIVIGKNNVEHFVEMLCDATGHRAAGIPSAR
jgi:hypothetical protein